MTSADHPAPTITALVVDHDWHVSLPELARAARLDVAWLEALVHEGAIPVEPGSVEPTAAVRFGGESLRRARRAARLARDFDLGAAETALVLDLLDEIERLRDRLRLAGR